MRQFKARDFYLVARTLELISAYCGNREQSDDVSDDDRQGIRGDMTRLGYECLRVGLHLSVKYVRDLEKDLEKGAFSYKRIAESISVLHGRIQDEIGNELFLHIPRQHRAYFGQGQMFGADVARKFPTAITDIQEASKCLALGRGTACVFHLMRVMEMGLRALAKGLKIPYAPSWESYLRQIEGKILEKHSKKSRGWKRQEPFYRDASGDLQMVKIAWRNPTMHIVKTYTPEEAEDVYRAVRTFMRRLASRFTQEGPIRAAKSP